MILAIYQANGIENAAQIDDLSDAQFKGLMDAVQSARLTAALLPLRRTRA